MNRFIVILISGLCFISCESPQQTTDSDIDVILSSDATLYQTNGHPALVTFTVQALRGKIYFLRYKGERLYCKVSFFVESDGDTVEINDILFTSKDASIEGGILDSSFFANVSVDSINSPSVTTDQILLPVGSHKIGFFYDRTKFAYFSTKATCKFTIQ